MPDPAPARTVGETVMIARCPIHGLHGQRAECFVCGGPVEQVAMVECHTSSTPPVVEETRHNRTVGENGVALIKHPQHEWRYIDADIYPDRETTHVAFPKDEAEALVEVARYADIWFRGEPGLMDALNVLDAARKQGGSDAI